MDVNLKSLNDEKVFDKNALFNIFIKKFGMLSNSSLEKKLEKNLKSGQIVRVGRNAYCINKNLIDYEFNYSDISINLANNLNKEFYGLDFRIFELYQLNRFLNHQLAHNVIFVFVEKELVKSVFEFLKKQFQGKILINPNEEEFYNYRQENTIIIRNLISESPKGKKEVWHTNLEKLLVDIFSEKLLKSMFSESEYPNIYETAFNLYAIDESQMFRYARRRKNEEKIKTFINEETNIILHLK